MTRAPLPGSRLAIKLPTSASGAYTIETNQPTDVSSIGTYWGENISPARAQWLDERLVAWNAQVDHGSRRGPFDQLQLGYRERRQLRLTGADVFYLAARALIGTKPLLRLVPIADLEEARAELRDPTLRLLVDLSALHLAGADLTEAHLTGATLRLAQLNGAVLRLTQLTDCNLSLAHLPMQICTAHNWSVQTSLMLSW